MERAVTSGALPVPFDATIPAPDDGGRTGTPPGRSHTSWSGGELPAPTTAPSRHDEDPPVPPTS